MDFIWGYSANDLNWEWVSMCWIKNFIDTASWTNIKILYKHRRRRTREEENVEWLHFWKVECRWALKAARDKQQLELQLPLATAAAEHRSILCDTSELAVWLIVSYWFQVQYTDTCVVGDSKECRTCPAAGLIHRSQLISLFKTDKLLIHYWSLNIVIRVTAASTHHAAQVTGDGAAAVSHLPDRPRVLPLPCSADSRCLALTQNTQTCRLETHMSTTRQPSVRFVSSYCRVSLVPPAADDHSNNRKQMNSRWWRAES